MRTWVLILTLAVSHTVLAHPSVGIVVAPNGDVFYSDLNQVWCITRTGQKRVVVPNVHSHELEIDSSGSVFGEDSKWLGGDRYRHRVWKRSVTGQITDVVPWKDGFWRAYGFTRDAAGAMYWITCTPAKVCTIWKRDRAGRTRNIVIRGRFRTSINWIVAAPSGEVYVIDGPDLRKVNQRGQIETVARISSRVDGRHELMGLSRDAAGNLYVAAHADRRVVRISGSGELRVIAQSTAPWAPSGVATSPNGDLWILEWAGAKVRVRRVSARGETIF